MSNRAADWLHQADADLRLARHALEGESYEWSCFAAQQAAEKAVKAVFIHHGMEAWGHTVSSLLASLREQVEVPDRLIESAKLLDKHYIPTRYPNGFDAGAPTDFYTEGEASTAVSHARGIIEFCQSLLH